MTLASLAELDYCYLTTAGRVSGRPHEIEIWFTLRGRTLYLLSGGRDRADWVRNVRRTPRVTVRLGDRTYAGNARIVDGGAEDGLARRLLVEKYGPRYAGDLSNWRETALPVAIDVVEEAG